MRSGVAGGTMLVAGCWDAGSEVKDESAGLLGAVVVIGVFWLGVLFQGSGMTNDEC